MRRGEAPPVSSRSAEPCELYLSNKHTVFSVHREQRWLVRPHWTLAYHVIVPVFLSHVREVNRDRIGRRLARALVLLVA